MMFAHRRQFKAVGIFLHAVPRSPRRAANSDLKRADNNKCRL